MLKLTKNQENTVIAIALIAFGLAMIIFPYGALAWILRGIGAVILIFKAIRIVTIIRAYSRGPQFTAILVNEIIAAVLALILLINPSGAVNVITLIIGVYLLITSLIRLWQLSHLPKRGAVIAAIALDVLTVLAGFWLIFHPASLAELIGIFLGIAILFKGAAMLIGLLAQPRPRDPKDDYITADFKDKSNEK